MGDFEKDLRDAFEGVEFTPSEQVWHGVEQGLRPKRKGIFLMWQTYGIAATLVFLLSMGYLFRDQLFGAGANDPAKQELTQNEKTPAGGEQEKTTLSEKETETQKESEKPASDQPAQDQELNNATPGMNDLQANNRNADRPARLADAQGNQGIDVNAEGSDQALAASMPEDLSVSALQASQSTEEGNPTDEGLLIDPSEADVMSLQELKMSIAATKFRWELENMVGAMAFDFVDELPEEMLDNQEQTILNGSLGSSSFNPNSSLSNENLAVAENAFMDQRFDQLQSASSAEERQLGSISVGAGLGLPMGNRWVFKTGIRYSQYRFASTGNAYSVEDGEELPIYTRVAFRNDEVVFSGNYELTNTLHSLSVPAQFGWRFLKVGKFNSWVNMGVAADYIVSYTVKGDLNFLETRQVDFAESNFIRRFNLNALTGMEFTYELNPKLALSGEIYYRQFIPFNNAESAYTATPSVLGFGLGVNYYLRRKK